MIEMNEREVNSRILELKKALGAYLKTYRSEYLQTAREYLIEISEAHGLKAIGCEEKCQGCRLGHQKLPDAMNPCRMWALHEAINGANMTETKNPRVTALAKELYDSLEK